MRKPDKYAELRINIRKTFEESFQRYGYRRLHAVLTTNGKTNSEKVIRHIMSEEGLEVYQKRRHKYNSYKCEISPEVDNLLERDFHAEGPNRKWLTDITDFQFRQGKYIFH